MLLENFGFSRLQLHKHLITFQLQMLANDKRNNYRIILISHQDVVWLYQKGDGSLIKIQTYSELKYNIGF